MTTPPEDHAKQLAMTAFGWGWTAFTLAVVGSLAVRGGLRRPDPRPPWRLTRH